MSTAMFTTLHGEENKPTDGWKISRWKFFVGLPFEFTIGLYDVAVHTIAIIIVIYCILNGVPASSADVEGWRCYQIMQKAIDSPDN